MSAVTQLLRPQSAPARSLAALLAAVVFALGLMAAAPGAHEALHDDAHEAGHSCAIILFAQGAIVAVALFLLAAHLRQAAVELPAPVEVRVERPARARPPPCGPPED